MNNISQPCHSRDGYTLIELVISLLLLSMIMVTLAMMLSSFIRFTQIVKPADNAEKFQTIHLMLEKQIEASPEIIVKNSRVYVKDLERPKLYYNTYAVDKDRHLLMRHKVTKDFAPIAGGVSQFVDGVVSYHLFVIDQNHFKLIVTFEKEGGGNETFDATIHYPGDPQHIKDM